MNVQAKLVDLHKQATVDRSHHYVGSVCIEASIRILELEAALRELLSLADITQPYPEHLASGIVSRARAALEPATSEPDSAQ